MKPDDLKALYRRGKAYNQMGKLVAAEEDLKKVQTLNPRGKQFLVYSYYVSYIYLHE